MLSTVAIAVMAFFSTCAFAISVSPGGIGDIGYLTDLGQFQAGSYVISGSGTVDLIGAGATMTINPDGTPAFPVTAPQYAYFNPNGSFTADGKFGAAGSNAGVGALIGTFNAVPTTASDWFLIGYSTTVTLISTGHIYASVNDTFHQNNVGEFNATVSAVPEPTTYVMFIAGLAALAARRGICRLSGKC